MRKYRDKQWLSEKVSQGFSKEEIAEECNISRKTVGKWMKRYNLGDNLVKCPKCDEKIFGQLGKHWNGESCEYPEFTDYQWEVLSGIFMGDGSINLSEIQNGRTPRFRCDMKKESIPYLKFLSEDVFPILFTDVKEGETSEQREKREDGERFSSMNNCSDMYYVQSRRIPEIQRFVDWYDDSSNKVWPIEEIELTPTILKHLYVGDGCRSVTSGTSYVNLTMDNQLSIGDEIVEWFNSHGFEIKDKTVVEREYGKSLSLWFPKKTSEKMFEYMGEPLPSFEYKWPEKYRD